MSPSSSATLLDRYLARCAEDAHVLLTRLCREAATPPSGGVAFLSPAQRNARALMPALAGPWAQRLAQPTALPPAAPTTASPWAPGDFGIPSGLALMSDDDVDEDIESTRMVQAIESAADWSLRDLRSRLASTPAPPGAVGTVGDDRLPLTPAKVVNALCATLHEQPVQADVRLAALRLAADPLARALAALYQDHAALLAEWGLEPARYTIRREAEPRPRAGGAPDAAAEPQTAAAAGAVSVPAARIPALLAHVAAEAGLSTGMQALMTRLAGPVAHSVGADPRLLDSMDNPLWRLIDRLAALGQLDGNTAPGGLQLPLHLRLEPIVAALENAAQPVGGERYAQALKDAEAEAVQMADEQLSAPTPFALSGLLNEPALAAQEQRHALEPLVRQQMVARLRDGQVIPEVRQFLLGPWVDVVLHAMREGGEEAAATQRVLGAVEALVEAGGQRRRNPLTPAELACLRMEAEDGLKTLPQLDTTRAATHVRDLAAALARWPRPAPDTRPASVEDLFDDDEEAGYHLPRHEELATVPAALDAHNPDERSLRDCEAWLNGLAAGDLCRIQRQGQWATLRLNWCSDNGTYFAFGNGAGLAFCASRRVLGRLRLEGMATTLARGQWVRRAVDTLPMGLDGR